MYLEKITIQNYGPIKNFVLDMPFNSDGEKGNKTPKPLVIVGKNGTGKTVILSHIVNSMLLAKQVAYDDSEIKKNYVYKVRSPFYINRAFYSYARLDFSDNNYFLEYVLQGTKKLVEANPDFVKPTNSDWDKMTDLDNGYIDDSFRHDMEKTKEILDKGVFKYFPSDRTSVPAWLNDGVLLKNQGYSNLKHFANISNRKIIYDDEFEDNKSWFMDIVLDRELYERETHWFEDGNAVASDGSIVRIVKSMPVFNGVATELHAEISKILNVIFKKYGVSVRLGVNGRKNRQLSVMKMDNNENLLPNLSQLSLGESVLLNLFMSIVRDADISHMSFSSLSEISGIVLIDEVENHLHNDLIVDALPELIKIFPKIQFIITSHSPIFLLGMEKSFGDGFQVIELDSSEDNGFVVKTAEEFSEFQSAFDLYSHTNMFGSRIANITKPVVLTEGKTDESIIKKAWSVLYSGEEMAFDIIGLDADGGSGASAVRTVLSKLKSVPNKRIIGLFDADKAGQDNLKTLVRKGGFRLCEDDNDIYFKGDGLFATSLPVPEVKKCLLLRDEGFEIEDYFTDESLGGYALDRINFCLDEHGNEMPPPVDKPMYKKFGGVDKVVFAEKVQGFDNSDGRFDNFKLLFDRLNKICAIGNGGTQVGQSVVKTVTVDNI